MRQAGDTGLAGLIEGVVNYANASAAHPSESRPGGFPLRAQDLRDCRIRICDTSGQIVRVEVGVGRRPGRGVSHIPIPVARVLLAWDQAIEERRDAITVSASDANRTRLWFREFFAVPGDPDPLPCIDGAYEPQWRPPAGRRR